MSDCKHTTSLGHLPNRLNAFGQIAPAHPGHTRLRFVEGEGDGGGDGGGGEGEGEGGDGDGESEKLGAAGVQALERTKTKLKTTAAELKSFKDLGLTPQEIADIVAGKKPEADEKPPVDERKLRQQIESEAAEKAAARYRASNVREQAATLGFSDPKDALAMLSAKDLAEVDVDDDGEVDEPAIKKLLEELAKNKPYLLKPTDHTTDHRTAGIGATGSGSKPEVQPGAPRLRNAYANTPKKK